MTTPKRKPKKQKPCVYVVEQAIGDRRYFEPVTHAVFSLRKSAMRRAREYRQYHGPDFVYRVRKYVRGGR